MAPVMEDLRIDLIVVYSWFALTIEKTSEGYPSDFNAVKQILLDSLTRHFRSYSKSSSNGV
jgi:hypothetical protein